MIPRNAWAPGEFVDDQARTIPVGRLGDGQVDLSGCELIEHRGRGQLTKDEPDGRVGAPEGVDELRQLNSGQRFDGGDPEILGDFRRLQAQLPFDRVHLSQNRLSERQQLLPRRSQVHTA